MTGKRELPQSPTLNHERRFDGPICGIDEAGCAPLAGPVVAAAVRLPAKQKPRALRGLNDSKLLSADRREAFFDIIRDIADVGVGLASVSEIDSLNIHHANLLAMKRAADGLEQPPAYALVDGRSAPQLDCPVQPLIKGDRRSLSIAAASVIAKVTRDRIMRTLATAFPDYGWERNAGYPTEAHYLGLLRKGPCEHHRRSFAPVNTIFSPMASAWHDFRFVPIEGEVDPGGLNLFFLRNDLHAVFDRHRRHVGMLKHLRGGWIFRAIGYDRQGRSTLGAGPCCNRHGVRLAQASVAAVQGLFQSG
jgi:ribonuclease HII